MGCGASNDRRGKLGRNNKKQDDPELNGKAKFLSCPSVGEVSHPVTENKWFLIAFAPQTHHGLIIAARDMVTGNLLCKDVKDTDIAQEKEQQRITMSWNLFFKAISSEISKVGKTGAKVDFTDEGTMKLEIKIAIAGAAAQSRKPDLYTCELSKIETSPENLYRCFMEPIATYYGKKRTDLLDRPDPHKEKMYGECEANSIVKAASIVESETKIKGLLPELTPLRAQLQDNRNQTLQVVGRVTVLKRMLAENTAEPSVIKNAAEPPMVEQLDPIRQGQFGSSKFDATAAWDKIKGAVNGETDLTSSSWTSNDAMLGKLATMGTGSVDDAVEAASSLDADTDGSALSVVSYFMLCAYGVTNGNLSGYSDDKARAFLKELQSLHRDNAFHNGTRGACVLASLHRMVVAGDCVKKLRLTEEDVFAFVVAAAAHDVNHPGINNTFLTFGNTSRISPLYANMSPIERHQSSIALEMLSKHGLPSTLGIRGDVANLILSTDMSTHASFVRRFRQRSVEVADYGRNHGDRMLVLGLLLKLADVYHVCQSSGKGSDWWARQSMELEAQSKDEVSTGMISVMPQRRQASPKIQANDRQLFARHVVAPMTVLASGALGEGVGFLAVAVRANAGM